MEKLTGELNDTDSLSIIGVDTVHIEVVEEAGSVLESLDEDAELSIY
jgi:hypothetical protein